MTGSRERCFAVALVVLSVLARQACCSQDSVHRFAVSASDSIKPFIVVGGLSLLADGKAAKTEMIQAAKALAVTVVTAETLKSVTHSGCPSGHTSAAFSVATVIADYHPKYTIPAYAVAATIGWSRVEVDAHQWRDVIAGAALGYFATKHFTNQHIDITQSGVGLKWKW